MDSASWHIQLTILIITRTTIISRKSRLRYILNILEITYHFSHVHCIYISSIVIQNTYIYTFNHMLPEYGRIDSMSVILRNISEKKTIFNVPGTDGISESKVKVSLCQITKLIDWHLIKSTWGGVLINNRIFSKVCIRYIQIHIYLYKYIWMNIQTSFYIHIFVNNQFKILNINIIIYIIYLNVFLSLDKRISDIINNNFLRYFDC